LLLQSASSLPQAASLYIILTSPGVFVNGSLLTLVKWAGADGEDISADIQLAEVTADLGGD